MTLVHNSPTSAEPSQPNFPSPPPPPSSTSIPSSRGKVLASLRADSPPSTATANGAYSAPPAVTLPHVNSQNSRQPSPSGSPKLRLTPINLAAQPGYPPPDFEHAMMTSSPTSDDQRLTSCLQITMLEEEEEEHLRERDANSSPGPDRTGSSNEDGRPGPVTGNGGGNGGGTVGGAPLGMNRPQTPPPPPSITLGDAAEDLDDSPSSSQSKIREDRDETSPTMWERLCNTSAPRQLISPALPPASAPSIPPIPEDSEPTPAAPASPDGAEEGDGQGGDEAQGPGPPTSDNTGTVGEEENRPVSPDADSPNPQPRSPPTNGIEVQPDGSPAKLRKVKLQDVHMTLSYDPEQPPKGCTDHLGIPTPPPRSISKPSIRRKSVDAGPHYKPHTVKGKLRRYLCCCCPKGSAFKSCGQRMGRWTQVLYRKIMGLPP